MRSIVLDIEGTTTPVEFVTDVLFPYARAHLREFVERHEADASVQADLARLRTERDAESETPAGSDSIVAYVHWLMDRDRKSTGLKSLQGKIWESGYRSGELRGQIFPDVPPALARWGRQGRDIAIFSSGSVRAQQLLFTNSTAGDLSRSIREHFDTTTGPKTEVRSYESIARHLGRSPEELLFVSDVKAELDAARQAGWGTVLCVRSPLAPPDAGGHPVIHTFEEVCPER